MKIFFNRKLRRSPWGGGVHFVTGFADYLTDLGHQVTNEYQTDVDIIFMIDPRDDEGFGDINQLLQYKKYLKNNGKTVKVIHRINDSDIPRGTNFLVDLNIKANESIADETIFISEWLQKHYQEKGFNRNSYVIRNGTNLQHFNPFEKPERNDEIIKVVTHHWSDNYNKGFDSYIELDQALSSRKDIEFTYVGRYYKGYTPQNTKVIPPLYGKELGNELKKHDVYVTAARWEACGMHHIEAAACGLPIAYHKDGGGIVEMCKNYGVQFNSSKEVFDAVINVFSQRKKLTSKIDIEALNSESSFNSYIRIMKNEAHTDYA